MSSFLFVAFLQIGCAGPKGDIYSLTGLDSFSEQDRADILASVALINEKVGREVISTEPSGFSITVEKTDFPVEHRLGFATRSLGTCRVQFSPKIFENRGYIGSVVLHELGHCFGKNHDLVSGEIMSANTMPIAAYSAEKIDRFFQRLSLSVMLQ